MFSIILSSKKYFSFTISHYRFCFVCDRSSLFRIFHEDVFIFI